MAEEDSGERLKAALDECARLKEKNQRLKSLLGIQEEKPKTTVNDVLSPENRVALFRSLFRGREDVYPIRWESRTGSSGYSPACANEWKCQRPD